MLGTIHNKNIPKKLSLPVLIFTPEIPYSGMYYYDSNNIIIEKVFLKDPDTLNYVLKRILSR